MRNKKNLFLLVAINILLVLIPDGKLLLFRCTPQEIGWRKLTWEDFKATPLQNSDHAAVTATSIHYFTNLAYNYPQAIVFAAMMPGESWFKREAVSNPVHSQVLLEHEQGHFDLSELYTRILYDSLKKVWGRSGNEIDTIIGFWEVKLDSMNALYDEYTSHGADSALQNKWTALLQRELQSNEVPKPKVFIELTSDVIGRVARSKEGARNLLVNGLKEGLWLEYLHWEARDEVRDTLAIYQDARHEDATGYTPGELMITDHSNTPYYAITSYKDGKKSGISKVYYREGVVMIEAMYVNNKEDGIVKTFNKDGSLYNETPYTEGKENGISKTYYGSGTLSSELPFESGKKNGIYKMYSENGILKTSVQYLNDTAEQTTYYDENGNEIK